MEISNYLMFNGNAEEAMNFYGQALGAKVQFMQRYKDSPMPAGEGWGDKIMHASLDLDGATIMVSDSKEDGRIVSGDNVHLSLNFHSEEEIDRVFAAVSAGGTVTMPLQDTFWGARFGMCQDKFGIHWMFNYDKPGAKQS